MKRWYAVALVALAALYCICSSNQPIRATGSETETGCRVEGLVRSTDGTFLSGAEVILHPQTQYSTSMLGKRMALIRTGSTITDEQGFFSFDSVDTGKYLIEINDRRINGTIFPVYLDSIDTVEVQGSVAPLGSIIGMIDSALMDKKETAFIYITELSRIVPVDRTGRFAVTELPEWNYHSCIIISPVTDGYLSDSVHRLPIDTVDLPVSAGDTTIVTGVGSHPIHITSADTVVHTDTDTIVSLTADTALLVNADTVTQRDTDTIAVADADTLVITVTKHTVISTTDSLIIATTTTLIVRTFDTVMTTRTNILVASYFDTTSLIDADTSRTVTEDTAVVTTSDTLVLELDSTRSYALSFDGVNDVAVSNKEIEISGNASRTIEAWVMVNSIRESGSSMPILYWGNDSVNMGNIVGITGQHGPNIGYWNIWNDVIGSTEVKVKRWYHIAIVHDGKKRTLYLNGVEEIYGSSTAIKSDTLATASSQLHIGNYLLTSAWGNGYFDGAIDDIRIWNIARSGDEIRADMNQTLKGDEPGLKYYYPLDEGKGRVAADAAGDNTLVLGKTDQGDDAPVWIERK